MEPMEIRIWNSKVNLLEKTEEIIHQSDAARRRRTAFYEGLSLFFAQCYTERKSGDTSKSVMGQQTT
jgi:hypothetical protein